MATTQVIAPYPTFCDTDGSPLDSGFIYLGFVNMNPETDPIDVFWDQGLSIPAAQPIRTLGGYPSRAGTPATLYTDGTFSITVKDKRKQLVFYSPVGYNINTDSVAASSAIQIVANNIGSINDVSGNMANIDLVDQNLGDIKAVAGDLGGVWGLNVTYDFGSITDPPTGVISPPGGNIVIVATNIVNVNIVATNIASVNIVAANIDAIIHVVDSALLRSNNLSDLLNVPLARTNLGLGTMALRNNISPTDLAQPFNLGTVP